jgi:hypothetical protein
MRRASPETKRRYQLGMVEQVRQNLEKANQRVYGRGKVLRIIKRRPFECKFLALALEKKGAPVMESTKYVGLDVHQEATTVAVMNSAGKLIMESTPRLLTITFTTAVFGPKQLMAV